MPSLFSLFSFMSFDKRFPATLSYRLQCQLFSIFSFGSSACSFLLWRGSPFSRLSCLQLAVLFSVQTLLRVPAAVRTESGRLAPKAGGHPPLSGFHAVTCGLRCLGISPASIMRTGPCYSRRMCADAVREDY